ncbi:MAG: hypothetical protein ACXABK_04230, partial [Candidatus Heimdallarchaeaceae archaeon]
MTTEERKVRDFGLIFYIWFLVVLAAYAFGAYSIYALFTEASAATPQPLIDWILLKIGEGYTFIQDYIWWVVLVVAVLFIVGIIVSYFEVWVMSYIGAELVNTVIFGGTFLL